MFVIELSVFFLQVAGIGQQDSAQIYGRWSRINRPTEAFFHQSREPSAMVKMCMGQHDGINLARGDRGVLPVALAPFLWPLEHATVDESLEAAAAAGIRTRIYQVLVAGDGSSGTKKLDVGHVCPCTIAFMTEVMFDFQLPS